MKRARNLFSSEIVDADAAAESAEGRDGAYECPVCAGRVYLRIPIDNKAVHFAHDQDAPENCPERVAGGSENVGGGSGESWEDRFWFSIAAKMGLTKDEAIESGQGHLSRLVVGALSAGTESWRAAKNFNGRRDVQNIVELCLRSDFYFLLERLIAIALSEPQENGVEPKVWSTLIKRKPWLLSHVVPRMLVKRLKPGELVSSHTGAPSPGILTPDKESLTLRYSRNMKAFYHAGRVVRTIEYEGRAHIKLADALSGLRVTVNRKVWTGAEAPKESLDLSSGAELTLSCNGSLDVRREMPRSSSGEASILYVLPTKPNEKADFRLLSENEERWIRECLLCQTRGRVVSPGRIKCRCCRHPTNLWEKDLENHFRLSHPREWDRHTRHISFTSR